MNDVPGPTAYQRDISVPTPFKKNRCPFNQKCPRDLPEDPRGKDAPSVGTYNWFVKHKQFEWQRDTNLKPVNLPKITFESTVCANTTKLPNFHEERKYQRRLRYFENYFKDDVI
ncbi:hypothetical protein TcWFU_008338 [Taenia crassiceps]|uniref:Uncharacterized protein n=1 Tax=Taenia crassiceps TaxID=6207 RepID=A0ABR4QTA0_9CEST